MTKGRYENLNRDYFRANSIGFFIVNLVDSHSKGFGMKAVLVVDIPTDQVEDLIAFVTVYEGNVIIRRTKLEPIPLPHKYGVDIKEDYAFGWNDAIDSITGEI